MGQYHFRLQAVVHPNALARQVPSQNPLLHTTDRAVHALHCLAITASAKQALDMTMAHAYLLKLMLKLKLQLVLMLTTIQVQLDVYFLWSTPALCQIYDPISWAHVGRRHPLACQKGQVRAANIAIADFALISEVGGFKKVSAKMSCRPFCSCLHHIGGPTMELSTASTGNSIPPAQLARASRKRAGTVPPTVRR